MPDPVNPADLAKMLQNFAPGHLPQELFEAVARLVVTPTFVVVPLFRRQGRTRVILTRRATDDPQYSGLLHPPGKIILVTDDDLDAVFHRLIHTELPGLNPASKPVFVAPFFDRIHRGKEVSLVHYLSIDDPSDAYESFESANLPQDVIGTDIPRILSATDAFESDL